MHKLYYVSEIVVIKTTHSGKINSGQGEWNNILHFTEHYMFFLSMHFNIVTVETLIELQQ